MAALKGKRPLLSFHTYNKKGEAKMEKKGSRSVVVVLVAVLVVVGVSWSVAAEWADILKDIKAKYAPYKQAIKDMTMEQEMKATTPQGEMTSLTKVYRKGEKFRIESTTKMPSMPQMPKEMQEMKSITINDGKDIWMISPFSGKQKIPAEQKTQRPVSDWWDLISDKAKLVGSENVGGRDSYVIEFVEQKDFPYTKVWLDKKSLVLTKAESKPATGETTQIVFSDFKKVKDWETPYKTEVIVGGKPMSVIVVKSLEVNKGLSDDLFDAAKEKEIAPVAPVAPPAPPQ
jgi:outer membrane lipoprotein-sorting protein